MKIISSILICLSFSLCVTAQTAVLTTGDTEQGQTHSVSYSIGQVFVQYATDSVFSTQQGVQQSFQLIEVPVQGLFLSSVHVDVYPNPVIDYLYMDITGAEASAFKASLMDEDGKLLHQFSITDLHMQIPMGQYLSSKAYYLVLYYNDQLFKSYKLIKKE